MIPTLLSLLALSASGAALDIHAPHYSLYLYDDVSFGKWPAANKVQPYNRLLLAFWESGGPTSASSSWAGFSNDQRQSILNDYHNAGIAVMVSAFGAGDSVIGKKKDPVKLAQDLASWANQYNVDGVDIDLEDFDSLQNDKDYALDWLTKFYNELSNQLGGKAISSTPTAWMYGSVFGSADSVYCKLNSAVGDKISWYNMQLYNGAQGTWNNCQNTVQHSDNGAFLALNDISSMCGIPLSKMTVGKLWDSGELAHPGTEDQIMAPAQLGQCLASSGTGGVMVWSANLAQWDQPLNYLKDTLGASSAPAAASSSAAPAGNNLAAASASSAASSAAPASSDVAGSSTAPASSSDVAGSSAAPASSEAVGSSTAPASSDAAAAAAAGSPNSASGTDATSSGSAASSESASVSPSSAAGSASANGASSNVGGAPSASSGSTASSGGAVAASSSAVGSTASSGTASNVGGPSSAAASSGSALGPAVLGAASGASSSALASGSVSFSASAVPSPSPSSSSSSALPSSGLSNQADSKIASSRSAAAAGASSNAAASGSASNSQSKSSALSSHGFSVVAALGAAIMATLI